MKRGSCPAAGAVRPVRLVPMFPLRFPRAKIAGAALPTHFKSMQAPRSRIGISSTACASLPGSTQLSSGSAYVRGGLFSSGALCPVTVRFPILCTLAAFPRRGTHSRPGVAQPEEGQPLLASSPGSLLQRAAPRSALCRPPAQLRAMVWCGVILVARTHYVKHHVLVVRAGTTGNRPCLLINPAWWF